MSHDNVRFHNSTREFRRTSGQQLSLRYLRRTGVFRASSQLTLVIMIASMSVYLQIVLAGEIIVLQELPGQLVVVNTRGPKIVMRGHRISDLLHHVATPLSDGIAKLEFISLSWSQLRKYMTQRVNLTFLASCGAGCSDGRYS